MKKILLLSLFALFNLFVSAQNPDLAMTVLNKTAAVVGRKGGAQAN